MTPYIELPTCDICQLNHETVRHNALENQPIHIEPMPAPRKDEIDTLIEYWHTSKCHSSSRYDRMQYVVRWFCKKYPSVGPNVAYKWLDQQLA